jgi:hypothetical protein
MQLVRGDDVEALASRQVRDGSDAAQLVHGTDVEQAHVEPVAPSGARR